MYKIVMTEKVVKAVQDYMDELWAEKAVTEFNKNKRQKLFSLADVKKLINTAPENS